MNVLGYTENLPSRRKYRDLGRRLRQARKFLGYSREQIALQLCIEPSQLLDIERGVHRASGKILTKFSGLYERPVEWLTSVSEVGDNDEDWLSTQDRRQLSEEDRNELRNFQQVIQTKSSRDKIPIQSERLSKLTKADGCIEELHEIIGTYDAVRKNGSVDIFTTIAKVGVVTILRPLGFLGVLLKTDNCYGLMLSVSESMNALRFAAASTLAKLIAKNPQEECESPIMMYSLLSEQELSISDEENFRNSLKILLPDFLLAETQKRCNWVNRDLANPINMYQASLRLGASYHATTMAYFHFGRISIFEANELLKVNLLAVKRSILANRLPDDLEHVNVWLLTHNEQGSVFRANPNDVFVIKLKENGAAGYFWDFSKLKNEGFTIISDENVILDEHRVGALSLRSILAKPSNLKYGDYILSESCPWERESTEPNDVLFPYRRLTPFKVGLFRSKSPKDKN